MKGIIRKADIVLAVVLVALCALSCWFVYGSGGAGGAVVVIEHDGEVWGRYSLYEEQTIDIDTEVGHNQAVIEAGRVYMAEASCPDHYCLGQHRDEGGIDGPNETIVCLPNKVVVYVEGGSAAGAGGSEGAGGSPDAVTGVPVSGGGDSVE